MKGCWMVFIFHTQDDWFLQKMLMNNNYVICWLHENKFSKTINDFSIKNLSSKVESTVIKTLYLSDILSFLVVIIVFNIIIIKCEN